MTPQEIRKQLIADIEALKKDDFSVGAEMRKFVDRMVEHAINKFDQQALNDIEIGRLARELFSKLTDDGANL